MSEMTNDVVEATLDTLVAPELESSPEKNADSEATNECDSKEQTAEGESAEETKMKVESPEDLKRGSKTPQSVPYDRMKAYHDKYKSEKERNEQLEIEKTELSERLENLESQMEKVSEQNLTPEEKSARDAMKTLEEHGYAKKDEIMAELEAEKKKAEKIAQANKEFELEVDRLEQKFSDKHYPKIDRMEIADFMSKNKLHHLTAEQAYKLLHLDEITDAKIKMSKAINNSVSTEGSDGSGAGIKNLNDVKKKMFGGDKKAESEFLDALLD